MYAGPEYNRNPQGISVNIMAEDIITFYCKGAGTFFKGKQCQSYLFPSTECVLLKNHILLEIFKKGRCNPPDMLKKAIQINLCEYIDLIQPEEYLPALSFETEERLKQTRLKKGWTLYVLKGYINIAAYRSVRETLQKEGFLPKRFCGYCIHLSPAKPAVCQRETVTGSDGEEEHPLFGQKRNPSDRACQKGFETFTFEAPEGKETIDTVESQQRILLVAKLLQDRIERAEGELRTRYERQYFVFCKLIHWIEQTTPWEQEKKRIADDLGVSLKTIDRDIHEILDILEREDVL